MYALFYFNVSHTIFVWSKAIILNLTCIVRQSAAAWRLYCNI
uniref:Uncharacterized protein n=1 Tax=Anguilla anguilla TaxID=7936 RepID=A0A0E9SBT9_ANGAN